jgi:hypothetical protein
MGTMEHYGQAPPHLEFGRHHLLVLLKRLDAALRLPQLGRRFLLPLLDGYNRLQLTRYSESGNTYRDSEDTHKPTRLEGQWQAQA